MFVFFHPPVYRTATLATILNVNTIVTSPPTPPLYLTQTLYLYLNIILNHSIFLTLLVIVRYTWDTLGVEPEWHLVPVSQSL